MQHWQNTSLGNLQYYSIKYGLVIEEWKDIDEYVNLYSVSSFGRIKSFKRKKITVLKTFKGRRGYRRVCLVRDIIDKKYFSVHRLVANAFILNGDNKPYINHINSIVDDNEYNNLEWVTPMENTIHGKKYGNIKNFGTNNPNNILTEKQVLIIFNSKEGATKIGKRFNVKRNTVHDIRSGNSWSYLTGKKR